MQTMHIESTLTLITAVFSFRIKQFSPARPDTVPIFFAQSKWNTSASLLQYLASVEVAKNLIRTKYSITHNI